MSTGNEATVGLQRRSSGASLELELDWTHEKGKHRSVNAVAPVPGGGAAEVPVELSQVGNEAEDGTAAVEPVPAGNQIRPAPLLTCEPVVAQEAIPV